MTGLRIADAIDMHCHFGPDMAGPILNVSYAVTGLKAAQEAQRSGHRAIVLKSHGLGSAPVAFALSEMVPGLKVFGGICTDQPTGGLNVDAVNTSLNLGGKIVWLPTIHSHQDFLNGKAERYGIRGAGLRVIDDDGRLTSVVQEIFALVREQDAILATGHITAEEHYAVASAFASRGKVLVTHAGEALAGPRLSARACRELADLGATIELTALTCDHVHDTPGKTPRELAELIASVGADRCTLGSDYGWFESPHPATGLQDFLERLWKVGVTEADLNRMAATNPARLLSL